MIKNKILPSFLFVGLLLCFSACKKSYSCTCQKPGDKDPAVSTWKLKYEEAKSNCDILDANYEEDNGNCTLSEN